MSQENVEIVLSAQVTADLARTFRDDATWAMGAAYYAPDFEHVSVNRVESPIVHSGLDQFRKAWLQWLKPGRPTARTSTEPSTVATESSCSSPTTHR